MEAIQIHSRTWRAFEVQRRTDGFISATSICTATGKDWYNYKNSTRAENFARALSKTLNIPMESLLDSRQGGGKGTWIHPQWALDLAYWASAEFAVFLSSWITVPLNDIQQQDSRAFLTAQQFQIKNEEDLHTKVIQFMRKRHPSVRYMPSLGETGRTREERIANWRKGYQKGSLDLFIYHRHPSYTGLCFEFKNPNGNGVLSEEQSAWANDLAKEGWKVVISCDYDEIILTIENFLEQKMYTCLSCSKAFDTNAAFIKHQRTHRQKRQAREDRPQQHEQGEVSDGERNAAGPVYGKKPRKTGLGNPERQV